MYSKELMKGTLNTIVLSLLAEKGRMYGYEISQAVKERSKGKMLVKEGSLYPALHKMLADEWLTTTEESNGKRIRVYYELTTKGRIHLGLKKDELFGFFSLLQEILLPNPIHLSNA